MSKKKIMISFRADEYLLNEMTRILPYIQEIGSSSDLLRTALSTFISRYKREHNIV